MPAEIWIQNEIDFSLLQIWETTVLTRWTNLQAVVISKSIHIQSSETTTISYTAQSIVGLNWKDLLAGARCISADVEISSLCIFSLCRQFNLVSDCWYWQKSHCSSWGYWSLPGTLVQLCRFPFLLGSVCNSRCLEERSRRSDQRRRHTTGSCKNGKMLLWRNVISCHLPHRTRSNFVSHFFSE